ncbi:MAG: iron donor protein CyaY [Alphaproteobacteria bacterium]|jgi:frataxin|nr:iron donor protein CyaY [Rickettsiales bacterium]
MLDETDFHRRADATLAAILDRLEPRYEAGALEELELHSGILTILTDAGRRFVVSKHAPSRQLWLASPLSGGLHFSVHDNGQWQLSDGRELVSHLLGELTQ